MNLAALGKFYSVHPVLLQDYIEEKVAAEMRQLVQRGGFGAGCAQDGNVGVGVFPQR